MQKRIHAMLACLVTSAVFLATAPSAHAATIDFEDIAVPQDTFDTGGDRTSGGFFFDSSTNHTHLAYDDGQVAHNGSTQLTTDDALGANILTMSAVSGAAFSLQSVDLAEGDQQLSFSATSVQITGNLSGGGTVVMNVLLDGVADGAGPAVDFQTALFGAGWSNLTSVEFDAAGGSAAAWALDNINTAPVPEPATIAMFGLGAVGLLGMARRRRKLKSAATQA